MGKVIFWLVVFFAVLFVLRLINVAKAKARRAAEAPPAPKPDATPPSAMVRCVECGVFLPKADARPVPQGYHCGQVGCAQQRKR